MAGNRSAEYAVKTESNSLSLSRISALDHSWRTLSDIDVQTSFVIRTNLRERDEIQCRLYHPLLFIYRFLPLLWFNTFLPLE